MHVKMGRIITVTFDLVQDSDDEPIMNVIPKSHHNKRKREEETQEKGWETEADGFRGKRPRRQSIGMSPGRVLLFNRNRRLCTQLFN